MNHQYRFVILAFVLNSFCLLTGFAQDVEDAVSFNRDIRSILSDRCFQCHGPDENERAAELRLDRADGEEGAFRTVDGSTAIKPGSLESSEVWKRIITNDLDEIMPPPDANKKPLTDVEKNLIKVASTAFWASAAANSAFIFFANHRPMINIIIAASILMP